MRRMTPNTTVELVPIEVEPLTIGDRFRANVRRLMRQQNLSQAGLAERLNELGKRSQQSAVAELLTSTSSPRADWIELMARVFGVRESDLLESQSEFSDE